MTSNRWLPPASADHAGPATPIRLPAGEDHLAAVAAHSADAAGDPGAVTGCIAGDEPVVIRLGDFLRDAGISRRLSDHRINAAQPSRAP